MIYVMIITINTIITILTAITVISIVTVLFLRLSQALERLNVLSAMHSPPVKDQKLSGAILRIHVLAIKKLDPYQEELQIMSRDICAWRGEGLRAWDPWRLGDLSDLLAAENRVDFLGNPRHEALVHLKSGVPS